MELLYKRFLIGYVLVGHNCTDSAKKEVCDLTNRFVDSCDLESFFTSEGVSDYVAFLERHISDKNRRFVNYTFNERRYVRRIEEWIKWLITEYVNE